MDCSLRLTKVFFGLLPVLFLLSGAFAAGKDRMKGPAGPKRDTGEEQYGRGEDRYVNFYQQVLSPVRAATPCPMHPSCSQYAKIAFKHYSPVRAMIMTCDRLIRCGNELAVYPTIVVDGHLRWYDPVPIDKHERPKP